MIINQNESPENPVPYRKYIAVVGIRVRLSVMMMYPMYIWCAKHPTQCFVEPFWHTDVGVIELSKHYRHGLVQKDHPHRSTDQDDSKGSKYKSENTLPGMVPVG